MAIGRPVAPTHHHRNHRLLSLTQSAGSALAGPDFLPRHSAVDGRRDRAGDPRYRICPARQRRLLPFACLAAAPPRSPDLVAAAELYLGCPYRWGGRSFLGIDCSGLVQNAFRDLGITVLRDTDMQRDTIGEPVPAAANRSCGGAT